MKKWQIWILVIVVVVAGLFWLSRPEKIEVTLASVVTGSVEKTVSNTRAGTVEACKRSKLSLPIGGQIAQLLVKEGDSVEAGQLLVTLWNDDRKARVSEAQAAVHSAKLEAKSQCVSSKSDAHEARRVLRLVAKKLISEEKADLANAKADASAARCDAMNAKQLQVKAGLDVAEAIFAQTELRAPFNGIVAEVTGKIGEYSTPSPPGVQTPPAIDLMTNDCHYLSAPIDEVDASDIVVGLPVKVSLDAFRGQHFEGKITRIAPYVLDFEKQARTVEVEAEFVNLPEGITLLAGYSADLEIILETHHQTLRLPSELIVDGRYVMVLNDDNVLEKRKITKGITNWQFTEIVSGLSASSKVVANIGDLGVVAGAKATVKENTPAQDDDNGND